MTLGEHELLHPPAPEPLVRAPRAKASGQAAVDEAWSLLVQQALGLGAPRLPNLRQGEPPPEPAAPGKNGSTANLGVAGGRSASLPASPADQEGIYRGLLWVAWAVEECSRAFTRISSRLASLERRIADLERQRQRRQPPSPSVFDVESAEAPDAGARRNDVEEKLDQLEARVEDGVGGTRRRVDALEERLRQLDFVPLKVSNLQRSVDQLAAARRMASEPAAPAQTGTASEGDLAELRHELAGVHGRLAELEGRVSDASVTAAVEAVVSRHAELHLPPAAAAVDVEGVYRELDAVAEFVAARAASTAESLERIAPLEVAVLELRRDLGRAIADFGGHAGKDATLRLAELEPRLRRLEASGEKLDRLYAALEALAAANGA